MDMNKCYSIIFKFDGCFGEVVGQDRKIYRDGKQKTLKFDKEKINFDGIREKCEVICPRLRGKDFYLHHHVIGTSPKVYKLIISDDDVKDMLIQSNEISKIEIVVSAEVVEDFLATQNTQVSSCESNLENIHQASVETKETNNMMIDVIRDDFFGSEHEQNKTLSVGSFYEDSTSFKHVLRTYAILNNFAVKIVKSDKTRVLGSCAHTGCPWRVRACLCSDGRSFEVKKLSDKHICPGVNRGGNNQATISWVANEIMDSVKKNPEITPKEINNNLEVSYGLSLPYMKVWRSREQARDILFGSIEDNYKWVPTLQMELMNRNPGSYITYTYDLEDYSFKRFYVSFKVCKDGFLNGCRHLIGVDACHLKAKYLGVLLAANGLDGNNGLFTIAFAVVESESKSSWGWFMRNLLNTIGCEVDHLAFISDMEKGLAEAIRNVFPNAEHRVCMRHLWKNMKKHFRCDEKHKLTNLVWTAANTYIEDEFNKKLDEIQNLCPEAHAYLLSLPYKWSKSNFSSKIKMHYNTNNMSESFNAWIEEARGKPVVDLIDLIRGMLMERRAHRKMNSAGWKGQLVPNVEDYIRDITTQKEQFIIRDSSSTTAEVEGIHCRYEVDIEKRECGCKFWQCSGLPCIHAVAFIGTKQNPVWHYYVDDCYHVDRFKIAYDGVIATLPGKDQWKFINNEVEIGVPKCLRPRGRPKKRRIKSCLEGTSRKTKNGHKCGRCGLYGHNKSTCKNPLNEG